MFRDPPCRSEAGHDHRGAHARGRAPWRHPWPRLRNHTRRRGLLTAARRARILGTCRGTARVGDAGRVVSWAGRAGGHPSGHCPRMDPPSGGRSRSGRQL